MLWELRNALVLPFSSHCWCATTHGPYMNQAVCSLDSLFGSASVLHLSTQQPPLYPHIASTPHVFPLFHHLVSSRCRLGRFPCFKFTKNVIFSRFCEKIFWEPNRKGKRPWTSCSILFPLPSRRLLTSKVEALNRSICAELRWS